MESKVECGLPCENDMCKMYKLSDDEREILEYRFEFPMVYLCDSHYHDPGVPGGGARHSLADTAKPGLLYKRAIPCQKYEKKGQC